MAFSNRLSAFVDVPVQWNDMLGTRLDGTVPNADLMHIENVDGLGDIRNKSRNYVRRTL